MRDACFDYGSEPVGPVTLAVQAGERVAHLARSDHEARVVARMAAGLVKASRGCVLLDEFDPRVQSVQCKRIVALVDFETPSANARTFERFVRYRARLWGADPERAVSYAHQLLDGPLARVRESVAYPLACALIVAPKIVILDRPTAIDAPAIVSAIGALTLLSTHADAGSARAYSGEPRIEVPA